MEWIFAKKKAEYIAKKVAVLPQTPTCPDTITVRELVSYGRFPYRKAIGGMSRHDIEQVDWALEKNRTDRYFRPPCDRIIRRTETARMDRYDTCAGDRNDLA